MPEEEARSMLRLIEERIGTSDIEVGHRDVLVRLRHIIEEDLTADGRPDAPRQVHTVQSELPKGES